MPQLRVSAVSYFNTLPLVWGMVHGLQQGIFDLRFELPAVCAESLESGTADGGLVPVIEVERQGLMTVPGLGIASDGPVRSILLISRVPAHQITSVALDDSSRTSVALLRIVLAEKYGVNPQVARHRPSLAAMLEVTDAALIIGDPALRIDLGAVQDLHAYDLGREWKELTGLPMVYAVWAGRFTPDAQQVLEQSYEFGCAHLDEIVRGEAVQRGFSRDLAREYLTERIEYRLTARHDAGKGRFVELARKHGCV